MLFRILLSAYLLAGMSLPQFRNAVSLFDAGNFEAARAEFAKLPDNALNDGYELLCDLEMRTPTALERASLYEKQYGFTGHGSRMNLLCSRILFDEGKYDAALTSLKKVREKDIAREELPELLFREGYCEFTQGSYSGARQFLSRLSTLPVSIYSAPSEYALGYMDYVERDFKSAESHFLSASKDSRFSRTCNFYIVECRFLMKDYEYVTQYAEDLLDDIPQERRSHLARLLSESYLVLDDKSKALDFYRQSYTENLSRADYFYAGSVLYAVDDFLGAIDNFTAMKDRSDSLGQIANYHLGNAYLRTRNRVSALEAFRDAAQCSFDPAIQEDAFINYAKLAFDINQDNSGFEQYIRKYSTSRRGELIYSYMALTALNRKDYAAAVDAYDHIDELDDDMKVNYMKANFLRGVQLLRSGAYRDAVPCLRAAAFYLPKQNRLNQTIRLWLAEAYYKTENFAEAERIYSDLYNISALQGTEEGDIIQYNLAYTMFNQGDYSNAARWFDNYLATSSTFQRYDAMLRRADCDFENKEYKLASKSYAAALPYAGDDLYPYLRQALSYGLSGDRKSKISILKTASGMDASSPMYNEVLHELGKTYMEAKNLNEALDVFKKLEAVALNNEYEMKALTGQGLAYRSLGKMDDALGCYKRVVEEAADAEMSQDALRAVESIYQAKKQPDKYLEYVEGKSLLLSKDEKDREKLYFNTAEQLFLAENYTGAVSSLEKFLQDYPESDRSAEAYFYLAESFRILGNKEKALDSYEKVWKQSPDCSFAESSLLNFSAISFGLEHFQQAYEGYRMLSGSARLQDNVKVAKLGMMRAAFYGKDYSSAISAAEEVEHVFDKDEKICREALYVKAKSCLAVSDRDNAMKHFRALAEHPSTAEGAEAAYMIAQDLFDRGRMDEVESVVYKFSSDYGEQSYWLAKAFIVLGDSFVERGLLEQAEVTYRSISDGYEASGEDDDIPETIEARMSRLNGLMKK